MSKTYEASSTCKILVTGACRNTSIKGQSRTLIRMDFGVTLYFLPQDLLTMFFLFLSLEFRVIQQKEYRFYDC
jgi:hypothetical protein